MMVVGLDELQYQKGVQTKLSRIWEQIDEFKDKPWLSAALAKEVKTTDRWSPITA